MNPYKAASYHTKKVVDAPFIDDCFMQGCIDGDWYKHHGVPAWPKTLGGRVDLTERDSIAAWKAGFKQGAGVSYEEACRA